MLWSSLSDLSPPSPTPFAKDNSSLSILGDPKKAGEKKQERRGGREEERKEKEAEEFGCLDESFVFSEDFLLCREEGGGIQRRMSCFSCCDSGDARRQRRSRRVSDRNEKNPLASLVNNISFKSDGTKHRFMAEEILKIGNGNIAARVFTFHELAVATKNFRPECLLGEGGFGRVYKGYLESTNQFVAVKQLDRNGLQGNREFLVEVLMLSLLHHPNLVNLLSYCADGDQRILVYEYMPLGSLEDHLLDLSPNKKPLDWNTRMKIAEGAAKGLEYLHDTANPPVIYRDFKASNILLDEEYNPKLSDFGLAKLGPVGDKSHVSTRVMGTYGYCAPEYAMTGQLTKMSDVYSFGVVFLEIITGRRAIDTAKPTCEQHLVHWAEPLFKDKKKFAQMADPLLKGNFPLKGLYQALAVAAMCLQEEASTRPLITDVVTALEYLSFPKCDPNEESKDPIPPNVPSPDREEEAVDGENGRCTLGGTEGAVEGENGEGSNLIRSQSHGDGERNSQGRKEAANHETC